MDSVTSAVSSVSLATKPPTSNGKIAWPGGPAKKQFFSLPDNIIYYMARNPKSPEVYLKLAKSCKYFFEKLPLLIVERIHDDGRKLCSNAYEFECRKNNQKCCANVDLAKITKSKIWLTGELYLTGPNLYDLSLASTLLTKLYCGDSAAIRLYQKEMSMEEFKLWGTKFTNFVISGKSEIIDAEENPVMIDSMLEALPNVKEFSLWFDRFNPAATPSTMKNILRLKKLDKFELLFFINPPEILAVEDYSAFMKTYKNTKIRLSFLFGYHMSEQYKLQLDALIDDIIASEILKHLIEYLGQDKEKLQIMKDRFFD